MTRRLRIAIQKKGRLFQESTNLLKRSGLRFRIDENSLLVNVHNMPIDLLLVRDDDIPTLIFDNICDGGIVGDNVLTEQSLARPESSFQRVIGLDMCRCRLSIATPEGFDFQNAGSLEAKRIATSYPMLLARYLAEHRVNADILHLSGSVEIAPSLKMADAICDLVSTGRTLQENQLVEVDSVFDSEAAFILAANERSVEHSNILNTLVERFKGVLKARDSKYIMFHTPYDAVEKICAHLPGIETPTIIPLNNDNKRVAVHVVSKEGAFWQTLETIEKMGASSILVLPIEKMLG